MTETQAPPDARGFGVAAMTALAAARVAVPLVPAGKPPAGMAAHAH